MAMGRGCDEATGMVGRQQLGVVVDAAAWPCWLVVVARGLLSRYGDRAAAESQTGQAKKYRQPASAGCLYLATTTIQYHHGHNYHHQHHLSLNHNHNHNHGHSHRHAPSSPSSHAAWGSSGPWPRLEREGPKVASSDSETHGVELPTLSNRLNSSR
jgi:hypothetical protein